MRMVFTDLCSLPRIMEHHIYILTDTPPSVALSCPQCFNDGARLAFTLAESKLAKETYRMWQRARAVRKQDGNFCSPCHRCVTHRMRENEAVAQVCAQFLLRLDATPTYTSHRQPRTGAWRWVTFSTRFGTKHRMVLKSILGSFPEILEMHWTDKKIHDKICSVFWV